MDAYGALVDLIYEAAVAPDRWSDVLTAIGDHVGAGPVNLASLDVTSGEGSILAARVDPEMLSHYWRDHASTSPVLIASDPADYASNWRLDVLTDDEIVDRDHLTRTEYYNEFCMRIDVDRFVAVRLGLNGRNVAALSIGRGARKGPFGTAEVDALRRLQPHLVRAFKLSERLADPALGSQSVLGTEALSQEAILLVDDAKAILFSNRKAEKLLEVGTEFRSTAGMLSAARLPDEANLCRLIGLATSLESELRSGGSFVLRSPEKRTLTVAVSPVGERSLALFSRSRAALVCIREQPCKPALSATVLIERFGLTHREAMLAIALGEGLTLSDAARRHGVARTTVGAQLGSIFAKTSTHRQAELLLLLFESAAL